MGLFKRKEKKGEKKEIPKLLELPKLPELTGAKKSLEEKIPQLPSFPNGSLGNKFSQNTIKEAVTGRKEAEEVNADEFAEGKKMQRMQKPLTEEEIKYPKSKTQMPKFERPKTKETERKEFYPKPERAKEPEPIFIRIDKFEEGSRTFEEVKKQISEIERMFNDIKRVKEEEEKELGFWENEIKKIKEKIEKIDDNIFSKIE